MKLREVIIALRKGILLSARYLRRTQPAFKSVVEKYPDTVSSKAPLDMFSTFKGYLRNDLSKCSGCNACVPACPVRALDFRSESFPDGSIKVSEFRIHLGKCFSCGFCVDICPETSLYFSKDFELVSERPEDLVMVLRAEAENEERNIHRIRTYEVRR